MVFKQKGLTLFFRMEIYGYASKRIYIIIHDVLCNEMINSLMSNEPGAKKFLLLLYENSIQVGICMPHHSFIRLQ
jgi:hypothetical protein